MFTGNRILMIVCELTLNFLFLQNIHILARRFNYFYQIFYKSYNQIKCS